ncbi:VOC family protein [Maricaulis sp. CAU 1757]
MRIVDSYPLVVTPDKTACRDFWTGLMDFQVGFDSSWFVWLHNAEQTASLAFMTPDHPSAPPGAETFSGLGMTWEVQVEDAEAAYEKLLQRQVPISYDLRDEPFGQKRFGFHDPSGLWVDIVEQIAPADGYWDRYTIAPQPAV